MTRSKSMAIALLSLVLCVLSFAGTTVARAQAEMGLSCADFKGCKAAPMSCPLGALEEVNCEVHCIGGGWLECGKATESD